MNSIAKKKSTPHGRRPRTIKKFEFHAKGGRAFFFLDVVLLLLAFSVMFFCSSNRVKDLFQWENANQDDRCLDKPYVHRGPWGTLQVTPISLQPEVLMLDLNNEYYKSRYWRFEHYSKRDVEDLFIKGGLDSATRGVLLENTSTLPDKPGYITAPPDSIVWHLSTECRERMYPLLASMPENSSFHHPFCYKGNALKDWFIHSGLSPRVVKALLPLVYRRFDMYCVSSLHLLADSLKTLDEKILLLKILNRQRALNLELAISKGEDVSALVNYWGTLGRKKRIQPILQSLGNLAHGGTIDVGQLLPPIPKTYINRYTFPEDIQQGLIRDCFWLSFNFFNRENDHRFDDPDNRPELIERITALQEVAIPVFGDLVFISNQDGYPVHCCVYIADNIVMTKNGESPQYPYIFETLDDVRDMYSFWGGINVVFKRRTVDRTQELFCCRDTAMVLKRASVSDATDR